MDEHYSMNHPSPTKKRRLSPLPPSTTSSLPLQQLFTLPGLTQQQALHASPPFQPLPLPLSLLALACALRSHALSFLPSLAKRPSSSSATSAARYAYIWSAYQQAKVGELAALRAACDAAAKGEYRGGRVELRCNAMKAEGLIDCYEGDAQGIRAVSGEVEEALSNALSIAQSHPSLQAYLPSLSLLQLRLSLSTSKPLKHTRQLLRRLISTLPSSSASASSAQAAASYAAHGFSATLPHGEVSDVERMAAWSTLAEDAGERGDEGIRRIAVLAEARVALGGEQYERCRRLLESVATTLGPKSGTALVGVAREERILWRLMRTIVLSQEGDVKGAKEMLKGTHKLLDEPAAAGNSVEGVISTQVGTPSSIAPFSSRPTSTAASAAFSLPPLATLYPFTFHLSAALHSDPSGRSPRSLLFAEEGVRSASVRLNARETPSFPVLRLADVEDEMARTSTLKVALHLGLARLYTMRSEWERAENEAVQAVEAAKGWGAWEGEGREDVREQTTLAWGLIQVGRAGEDDDGGAEKCFEAVIASSSSSSSQGEKKSGEVSSQRQHTRKLAMLSLLLLRMNPPSLAGSASTAPSPTKSTHSPSPSPFSPRTPSSPSSPHHYTSTSSLLSALGASPSSTTSSTSSSWTELIALLATALSAREITALKTALSGALTVANGLQANFVRAAVLGVLGVVFGWTREGEAHKMLLSCYKLAASMGPSTRLVPLHSSSPSSSAAASTSSIFPGAAPAEIVKAGGSGGRTAKQQVQVGNARLQGWAAERLLESYRSLPSLATPQQLKDIQLAREGCRVWLAKFDGADGS